MSGCKWQTPCVWVWLTLHAHIKRKVLSTKDSPRCKTRNFLVEQAEPQNPNLFSVYSCAFAQAALNWVVWIAGLGARTLFIFPSRTNPSFCSVPSNNFIHCNILFIVSSFHVLCFVLSKAPHNAHVGVRRGGADSSASRVRPPSSRPKSRPRAWTPWPASR